MVYRNLIYLLTQTLCTILDRSPFYSFFNNMQEQKRLKRYVYKSIYCYKMKQTKNLRNNGNYYLFFRLIKSCGKKSYHLFFHLTKDIQLRWFQCRILHLVLATNSLLFEIKIINTELCSFCSTHIEFFLTLTHLF